MGYLGITVDEEPNVPKNVKGTPVGNGLDAADVALWVDDGADNPRKLDVADLVADPVPNTLTAGTLTVTDTPGALPSIAGTTIVLQNDPDSAQDIFLGDVNSQPWQMKTTHQPLTLRIANANAIYVKTASSTAVLNYLVLSVA